MISLTDTSVFVAAVDTDHPHHSRSLDLFNQLTRPDAKCGAHTLAEVYSVLTRLPPPHRLSRERALFFIEQIVQHVEPVPLASEEYLATYVRLSLVASEAAILTMRFISPARERPARMLSIRGICGIFGLSHRTSQSGL